MKIELSVNPMNRVYKTATAAANELQEYNKRREELLKMSASEISGNERKKQLDELEQEHLAALRVYDADVKAARDAYNQQLEKAFEVDADAIDDADKVLLDANIVNSHGIARMVEKHKNNATMLLLISNYARSHELDHPIKDEHDNQRKQREMLDSFGTSYFNHAENAVANAFSYGNMFVRNGKAVIEQMTAFEVADCFALEHLDGMNEE